jgi:hypothetical protein
MHIATPRKGPGPTSYDGDDWTDKGSHEHFKPVLGNMMSEPDKEGNYSSYLPSLYRDT